MAAVTHEAADDAANELGLSRRQVYVLIARHRQGTGLLLTACAQNNDKVSAMVTTGSAAAQETQPLSDPISRST